ncbi:ryncolin-1-like isoform X3 [Saccostrea cucullata]
MPKTKGKDGVYSIYPDMNTKKLVYCDMTTEGGDWTVINKRMDGSVDFYRSWDSYKEGFGNVEGEYWLGNEPIHLLTKRRQYELRVDLQKFSGEKAFAKYSKFSVGSESQKFKLTVSVYSGTAGNEAIHLLTKRKEHELRVDLQKFTGEKAFAKYSKFSVGSESQKFKLTVTGYSGTAGDSFNHHNGRSFSTKDADNDSWKTSCAVRGKAGWWFGSCDDCNLNGPYLKSAVKTDESINWDKFGKGFSLKTAKMMIRPVK